MSKTWRYVKDYQLVNWWKVKDLIDEGYELVGGAFPFEGTVSQALVLYDDEVTLENDRAGHPTTNNNKER